MPDDTQPPIDAKIEDSLRRLEESPPLPMAPSSAERRLEASLARMGMYTKAAKRAERNAVIAAIIACIGVVLHVYMFWANSHCGG